MREILTDLCTFYRENGLDILGLTNSPVRGNGQTLEYLIGVSWNREIEDNANLTYETQIEEALDASFALKEFKKG